MSAMAGNWRTSLPGWLSRLLGPTEPELSCEECFEQLDRYVELELSGLDAAAAVPGMKAHLEGCPACREEHDDLFALVESGDRERDENRLADPGEKFGGRA
jgi:hypothetical protein